MSSFTDRVDALFSKWNTPDSPGCVFALIKDGEFIHTRGYGMADLERGVPITPATIFDIGSTGKQFTATVTAILGWQGSLDLDDSIRKHIPEMPAYADGITIRQLVHHTSGLRDYLTLLDLRGLPMENIYAENFLLDLIVRQRGLNFKPGSEYLYSNSGYFLLGIVAQRVTEKHITTLIKEFILDPLGMKNTTFNKDYRPIVKNRAMSYEEDETKETFINALALSGGSGDGAILSNVEDLLLWDRNFYNNKLNNSQNNLIEQIHVTGKLNNSKAIHYAFGLDVTEYKGQRVVQHAGGWAGYRSEMMRFPHQHMTFICLANLGSMDPTLLCQQAADIYLENVFTPTKRKKHRTPKNNSHHLLSAAEMETFIGVYQGKQSTVAIFIRDNALYFSNGTREHQLRPLKKKKFQLEQHPASISFTGKQNELLGIEESGEQTIKLKRIQNKRAAPLSLSIYTGEYFSPELNIKYVVTAQDNTLQLRRTPFEKPNPVRPFTENTFLCNLGEMRLHYTNGSVKGFTLHAGRVKNIKFRKVT